MLEISDNFSFFDFKEHRSLYTFRLLKGLACLDGPISMEDMRIPRLRRAISVAIRSVQSRLIVSDECHFGFLDSPDYFAMVLIADNEKLDMTVLCPYEYKKKQIVADPTLLDVFGSQLEIVSAVAEGAECLDTVSFLVDPVNTVMPLNKPSTTHPVVGFDVELVCNYPEVTSGVVTDFTSIIVEGGSDLTYIAMPINRYIDLGSVDYEAAGSNTITVEGGVFIGSDIGKSRTLLTDEVSSYNPINIKVDPGESVEVIVRQDLNYQLTVSARLRRDPKMKLFNLRFSNRCRSLLDMLTVKLKDLPQTLLVRRTLSVIADAIIGYRMPSKTILNQACLMVGLVKECTPSYNFRKERWRPYKRWENWNIVVRRHFIKCNPIKKVLHVFDKSLFSYNLHDSDGVFSLMTYEDLGIPNKYRRYADHLKACEEAFNKCSAGDSRRFNLYQEFRIIADEDGNKCYMPLCPPPKELNDMDLLEEDDLVWEEEMERRDQIL